MSVLGWTVGTFLAAVLIGVAGLALRALVVELVVRPVRSRRARRRRPGYVPISTEWGTASLILIGSAFGVVLAAGGVVYVIGAAEGRGSVIGLGVELVGLAILVVAAESLREGRGPT